MNVSQIQLEATRDAIVREQTPGFVRREADRSRIEFVQWMTGESTRTTRETDAGISLLIDGQVAEIGVLQYTRQQAGFHHRFQHTQHVPQQRITVPTVAQSNRIELRQQNETNRAVEQRSAREQKPLFEY